MNSCLEISLLDQVNIKQDGQPVLSLITRKAAALLIYLVCTGRAHSRDRLAELLWPERPSGQARRNLRTDLSRLRQLLAPYLVSTHQQLAFNQDQPYWLDVAELEQCVATIRPTAQLNEAQASALAEALVLYRDDFLAGFHLSDVPDFEAWAAIERERLHRLAIEGLHRLVAYYLEIADYNAGVAWTQRLLALDGFDELAHCQMMSLLSLSGQRSLALAHYQRYVQTLVEALEVEPGIEIRALAEQIKAGNITPGAKGPGSRETKRQESPEEEVVPLPSCPYKGLSAFTEADAPFFFGREAFTHDLSEIISQQPLVAVIGPSGSGKSSVVFGGLLPYLKDEGGRRRNETGFSAFTPSIPPSDFLIATFRPGSRPFQALAAALLLILAPQLSEVEQLIEINKLSGALYHQHLSLPDLVARILEKSPGAERLLLVVDQFEELYTLCPEIDIQRRFVDLLLSGGQAQRLGTRSTVLLTLRADFMGQALAYRPLADALQEAAIMLGPMNREEMYQAIKEPARKQNVAFEPGLVERILDDVGDEPGRLPLLEFALTSLWIQQARQDSPLTHAAYEAINRVQGALAYYADSVYQSLSQAEQAQTRRALLQLAQPGAGTEDTRRLANRAELGEAGWAMAQRLADLRLVVTKRDPTGQELVEVAHEALIHEWGQLRTWLNEDRAFRSWQERLRLVLRQWQASDQDEGVLLRGTLLGEAEAWMNSRSEDLSASEQAFIAASLRLRDRRLREAEEARGKAEQLARLALSRQLAAQAIAHLDQPDLSLLLSLEAAHYSPPGEAGNDWLVRLTYSPFLARFLHGLATPIYGLAFSPTGHLLAASAAHGEIILWDVTTGQPLGPALTGHSNWIMALAFSPDGRLLASGSDDHTIRLWEVEARRQVGSPLTGHQAPVRALVFSADGRTLLSSSLDKSARRWDVASGREVERPVTDHSAGAMTFSPDSQRLVTANRNHALRLWQLTTGQCLALQADEPTLDPHDVVFSSDSRLIAGASYDKTVMIWNAETGHPLSAPLTGHKGRVLAAAFSPDGRLLASGSTDRTIILWDVATGHPLGSPLLGHNNWVRKLAFSPDGRILASGDAAGKVVLWDMQASQRLDGHAAEVRGVAFSPDGRLLASSSYDQTIILWDVASRRPLGLPLTGHTDIILNVTFSPDGRLLATSSSDRTIILWDVAAHQPLGVLRDGHQGQGVINVAFSPDGRKLASTGFDGTVVLWDVATRQQLGPPLSGHRQWTIGLAFSPDGRLLASGSADQTIILWEVATHRPLDTPLTGHDNWVTSLTFSPDGRTLASGSSDNTVRLWDVDTRHSLGPPLTGHTAQVWSVLFNPLAQSQTLISGAADGTILIWDMATRQPLGPPLSTGTEMETMALSPDGRTLAIGGFDHTVVLQQLNLEPWPARACRIANRNLTQLEWEQFISSTIPYEQTCPDL